MNTYKSGICAVWITLLLGIYSCANSDNKESVEAVERPCLQDAECQPQERCVFRLCRAVCEQDQDCPTGMTCLQTAQGGACTRQQDNACLNDFDCPTGMKCAYGSCLAECGTDSSSQCQPGSTCVDGACQTNGNPPDSMDASTDTNKNDGGRADSGQNTPDGGTTALDCPPNSAQCRGDKVVRCDEVGHEQPEKQCPFVCREGQCGGNCKPGGRRCDGKMLQNCEPSGEWKTVETCPSVCTPDGCAPTCTNGEFKCNDSTLMVCKEGQMAEKEKCPLVCRNNGCTGECAPGKSECRNNGVVTCTVQGQWSNRIACRNACADGACSGECKPGNKRCVGTSGTYQTCNDRGQWGNEQLCQNKACISGECTGSCSPSAKACESNKESYKTCDSSGNWSQATTKCSNQTCVDNECAGECAPNQKQCKKDSDNKDTKVRQTCSDQGKWVDSTCSDACLNGVCTSCTPKARQCGGNTSYQECSDTGTWATKQCPSNTPNCTGAGVCSAPPACGSPSPHWEKTDGNQNLDDPLWETYAGNGLSFAMMAMATPVQGYPGNYRILLDRSQEAGSQGQLVVSIRATPEPKDKANTNDKVYFGIASSDGKAAQAVTMSLPTTTESGPITLNSFTWYAFTTSSTSAKWGGGNSNWLKNADLWTTTKGSKDWSWGINFRVDLTKANLTSQEPFRVALGMHIDNSSSASSSYIELFSPGQPDVNSFTDLAKSQPSKWLQVNPPPANSDCVTNVVPLNAAPL